MSKNKLYNQSYFVKRILEAGYFVTRLNVKFEEDDPRRWMIIINSKKIDYKFNICITCFKDIKTNEVLFKFQGQTVRDFSLSTLSMTTIISILDSVIKDKENNYFKSEEIENE